MCSTVRGAKGFFSPKRWSRSDNGCGRFDQVTVGTDEFTLARAIAVRPSAAKCTRARQHSWSRRGPAQPQGGGLRTRANNAAASYSTGFFRRGRMLPRPRVETDASISLGGLYFLAACSNILSAQFSFLVIDPKS